MDEKLRKQLKFLANYKLKNFFDDPMDKEYLGEITCKNHINDIKKKQLRLRQALNKYQERKKWTAHLLDYCNIRCTDTPNECLCVSLKQALKLGIGIVEKHITTDEEFIQLLVDSLKEKK